VGSVARLASAFHRALKVTKSSAPIIGTRRAPRASPSALELGDRPVVKSSHMIYVQQLF